jgi:hypothetical protein
MFFHLLEKVRTYDRKRVEQYRKNRDYEGLDLYTMKHLLGA